MHVWYKLRLSLCYRPFPFTVLPLEQGLNRSQFDEIVYNQVALVAPSWPDASRQEDVVQAIRWEFIVDIYLYSSMIAKKKKLE